MEIPADEVVFSTVARYALIGGFKTTKVMLDIYSNRKKRIHPFLPGYIERYASFFDLNKEEVIQYRTIYPLIVYSRPLNLLEIRDIMLNKSDDKVLLSTPVAHSSFRTFYGLKYCCNCVKEDINQWGFCYWHVKHQIPGIDTCYKHKCLLIGIPMGDGNKDRTLFLPPFKEQYSCVASKKQVDLAIFSAKLFDIAQEHEIDYKVAYKSLLKQKGLLSESGETLLISKIITSMNQYWIELPFSNHQEIGTPYILRDFQFLGPMLRVKTHSPTHPLKHLLLACYLTSGNAEKLLNIEQKPNLPIKKNITNCKIKIQDKVLKLLQQGLSLRAVELRSGKSRSFVRRIAELNKIPHKTNTLAYSLDIRRGVWRKALFGISRHEIAKALMVGIGYVEQVICNERNMSSWRKQVRIQNNVMKAYKKLESLKMKHPDWCRTQIRKEAQAAYATLYKHDKKLIESLLPSAKAPAPYKKNWVREDKRILSELVKIKNLEKLSLSALGRLVNDHGYLNRNLDHLPSTKAYLKSKYPDVKAKRSDDD